VSKELEAETRLDAEPEFTLEDRREFARIGRAVSWHEMHGGHPHHCAMRIVAGDGVCVCGAQPWRDGNGTRRDPARSRRRR
jgi:hypothetical protein